MEILGVGPLELFFILIIALIVLGPQEMAKTGRTIGRFLRRIVKSPTWQAVQQTSRDLKYLPNRLMREAGMEEDVQEIKQIGKEFQQIGKIKNTISDDLKKTTSEINKGLSAWTTPPAKEPSVIPPPPPDISESKSKSEEIQQPENSSPAEKIPQQEEPLPAKEEQPTESETS